MALGNHCEQPAERLLEGDVFVMKPDFTRLWRSIETTPKIWVIYQ